MKETGRRGDEVQKRVERVDWNVDDSPCPEEKTNVSSKLSPGPLLAVLPGNRKLINSFLSERNCFRAHVNLDTAPFVGSLDVELWAIQFDLVNIVESGVDHLAAF